MARKPRRTASPKPDPYPIDHNGITLYLNRFLEWSATMNYSQETIKTRDTCIRPFIILRYLVREG